MIAEKTNRIRARVIRDAEELRELEIPWNDMVSDSRFQDPFHCWDWYEAWWRNFGAGHDLFAIAGEDRAGRLQVLAPLMKMRSSVRGLAVSELRFFAHSITPHNTVLMRNACSEAEALEAVFACLVQRRDEWDMLNLRNVPAASSRLTCLGEIGASHGCQLICGSGMQSARIALDGDFETFMNDEIRKGRRRGIVQKVRQLAKQPGYRVVEFSAPEEIERGLKLGFTVSKSSWKGAIDNDMTGLEARRLFYRDVTPRLARRGEVKIWVSFLDDTPLALEYHLLGRDAVYCIVNDFNEAYQKLSPGTVLLYQVLERLFREKPVREFHFSGELYDYKTIWASDVRDHVNLEMFHEGTYSRCLWWGKKTMPWLRTLKTGVWAAFKKAIPAQAT